MCLSLIARDRIGKSGSTLVLVFSWDLLTDWSSPFLPSSTPLWVLVLHWWGSPSEVCFLPQLSRCCLGSSSFPSAPLVGLQEIKLNHKKIALRCFLQHDVKISNSSIQLSILCTNDVKFGGEALWISLRYKSVISCIMKGAGLNFKTMDPGKPKWCYLAFVWNRF